MQSLPVEIWNQILQDSISIPAFLDPDCLPEVIDPLDNFRTFHIDHIYWSMEFHRNTLQRVCKTWDAYLRQFEHRYVRVVDVCHRKVPKEALCKAIRINYEFCDSKLCDDCLPERSRPEILSLIPTTAKELMVEIISDSIHTQEEVEEEVLTNMLAETRISLPRLRIVLDAFTHRPETKARWFKRIELLPKLQFLRMTADTVLHPLPLVCSRSLTTLSYCGRFEPFSLPLDKCDLPALQHLRFTSYSHVLRHTINDLIPILEKLGRNLLSLEVGRYLCDVTIPQEIWELCPRLERLDSRLHLHYPPPQNHPLHTISAFFPYLQAYSMEWTIPFAASLLSSPSLRRIILECSWSTVRATAPASLYTWLRDCENACEENSVSLEDLDGKSFKDSDIRTLLPS